MTPPLAFLSSGGETRFPLVSLDEYRSYTHGSPLIPRLWLNFHPIMRVAYNEA